MIMTNYIDNYSKYYDCDIYDYGVNYDYIKDNYDD
jgi:hypothetical protein